METTSKLQILMPAATAVEHLERMLRDSRQNYCRALSRCAAKGSTKRVHAVRTEGRRVLVLLNLVAALTTADAIKGARRLVRHQLKALGGLRDLQVQLECLKLLKKETPVTKSLRRALRKQAERLAPKALRKLKPKSVRRRLKSVETLVRQLDALEERNLGSRTMTQALHQQAEEATQARPAIPSGPEIHRARIALRKFRLTAEVLQTFDSAAAAAALDGLHACQTLMGQLHDLDLLVAKTTGFLEKHPWHRDRMQPLLGRIERSRVDLIEPCQKAAEDAFAPTHGWIAQTLRAFERALSPARSGISRSPEGIRRKSPPGKFAASHVR